MKGRIKSLLQLNPNMLLIDVCDGSKNTNITHNDVSQNLKELQSF